MSAFGRVGTLLCACLALCLPMSGLCEASESSGAGKPGAVELPGSWHLTVHYRDEASGDPNAERWTDRLWRFERRGSRMQWTEYSLVIFENREGRFQSTDGQRTVRSLHFWEPNDAQLAQIERGLLVNPRGARSKGLRGSPEKGYGSVAGLRSASVGVIGYSESWSVEGLPARPVFTQEVVMGSGLTENMQGRTRYSALHVSSDGREVRGNFERDGTRHGSFVLRRAGEPRILGVGKGVGKAGGEGGDERRPSAR